MKLIFSTIFFILIFHFAQVESQPWATSENDWELKYSGVVKIINDKYNSTCVGTLIHSKWILTSAVCAIKTYFKEMRILFGSNNAFDSGEHVRNTYIHPGFAGKFRENDIALLELAIPANTSVRILKIPKESVSIAAKRPLLVKWYYGDFTTNTDSGAGSVAIFDKTWKNGRLYCTSVVGLNNELCERYPVNINENRLCSYESVACEGDEGAPLVTGRGNHLIGLISVSAVQAAICSFSNCMTPVTTYTSVVPYRSWIKEVTQINIL